MLIEAAHSGTPRPGSMGQVFEVLREMGSQVLASVSPLCVIATQSPMHLVQTHHPIGPVLGVGVDTEGNLAEGTG